MCDPRDGAIERDVESVRIHMMQGALGTDINSNIWVIGLYLYTHVDFDFSS